MKTRFTRAQRAAFTMITLLVLSATIMVAVIPEDVLAFKVVIGISLFTAWLFFGGIIVEDEKPNERPYILLLFTLIFSMYVTFATLLAITVMPRIVYPEDVEITSVDYVILFWISMIAPILIGITVYAVYLLFRDLGELIIDMFGYG